MWRPTTVRWVEGGRAAGRQEGAGGSRMISRADVIREIQGPSISEQPRWPTKRWPKLKIQRPWYATHVHASDRELLDTLNFAGARRGWEHFFSISSAARQKGCWVLFLILFFSRSLALCAFVD